MVSCGALATGLPSVSPRSGSCQQSNTASAFRSSRLGRPRGTSKIRLANTTCSRRRISLPHSTWVFWHVDRAVDFCAKASYPLVLKLAVGFQSSNVRLLKDAADATYWARLMFGPGTTSVAQAETSRSSQRSALGRMRDAGRALFGRPDDPEVRES